MVSATWRSISSGSRITTGIFFWKYFSSKWECLLWSASRYSRDRDLHSPGRFLLCILSQHNWGGVFKYITKSGWGALSARAVKNRRILSLAAESTLAQVERHLCRKKLIILEKSSLIFCLGNKLGKNNGPQPYTAGFQESTYQISQNKRIVGLLQGWQRNPTSPEIPAQCCIQMKKVFEGNGSFQSQYFPPQQ